MIHEFIMSSCYGFIEEVSIEKDKRVYEWEKLFTIRTEEGTLETIRVGISGQVESIEVQKGDRVIPGMVLATINEDITVSAAD